MTGKLAILPLGRPTFDVDYARERLAAMLARIDALGMEIVGPRDLLFDADSTRAAHQQVLSQGPDLVLVLQVTFTDASMTCEIAAAHDGPLAIWSAPEPRAGGRLRLNAFCGLNLASHALGLRGREFSWLHADPDLPQTVQGLAELVAGRRLAGDLKPGASGASSGERGKEVARSLKGAVIARIGEPPAGFDTCLHEDARIGDLAGVRVRTMLLGELFDRARSQEAGKVAGIRAAAQGDLDGLEAVDQEQLDRSLRLKAALDELRGSEGFEAMAIRCWPETFTEYGGAVCGPVSMMGEKRVPCACEADVYGALTQMVLQRVADAPVFLADLVDIDETDNSAVVWHCGQAPVSMAQGGHGRATIHTNRKMPLLYEFALKPGRVTFMRISQAHGRQAMVIAGGQMLERPMAFTGTSGVVRFDTPAGEMARRVMASGLEHHMAIAYGEHRDALRDVAAAMNLPVLEL
jgi:L-fucose isomerase-like protein